MLEVLTDSEEGGREVVVKEEVVDFILDVGGSDAGIIRQAGTVADLCIETLAGCSCFVFLYEGENVGRHLIVAAPGDI